MTQTLDYYNKNAASFITSTQTVDFHAAQDQFLSYLREGAAILDFGCGSGRDTKYFLERGYCVQAIDGSKEICRLASQYTGIPVQHLLFQELSVKDCFDGIWACASILHVEKQKLPDVFRRMITALRGEGVIYTSFKYGTFEGIRNGRYFTDFDESSFCEFIKQYPELSVEKQWITADVRPWRSEEKWLNNILRKSITS